MISTVSILEKHGGLQGVVSQFDEMGAMIQSWSAGIISRFHQDLQKPRSDLLPSYPRSRGCQCRT
jgi:hypothetical protein